MKIKFFLLCLAALGVAGCSWVEPPLPAPPTVSEVGTYTLVITSTGNGDTETFRVQYATVFDAGESSNLDIPAIPTERSGVMTSISDAFNVSSQSATISVSVSHISTVYVTLHDSDQVTARKTLRKNKQQEVTCITFLLKSK